MGWWNSRREDADTCIWHCYFCVASPQTAPLLNSLCNLFVPNNSKAIVCFTAKTIKKVQKRAKIQPYLFLSSFPFFCLLFLLKAGKHCTKNSKEAGKLGQVRKEGMSTIVWECPSCLSNLKRLAWLDFCNGICLGIHHGDKLFKMRD